MGRIKAKMWSFPLRTALILFGLIIIQVVDLASTETDLETIRVLANRMRAQVDHLRSQSEQVEFVFLVDESGSIGEANFYNEIKFVKKMLSDFTVAYSATRVAVVTFSSQDRIITYVDQITTANKDNQKCILLNKQLATSNIPYTGGWTYTRGALERAFEILTYSRRGARKAVFLVTDGESNQGDPGPAAKKLKDTDVTIFTFGILTGGIAELKALATDENFCYLLDNFVNFESLAQRALHQDLKAGNFTPVESSKDCDSLCSATDGKGCCDAKATCTCGIATGHYSCLCPPGYFGSGLRGSCQLCPSGTYGPGTVPGDNVTACIECPDKNHITINTPSTSVNDCTCPQGFTSNGDKCEVITCPTLKVPDNGYPVGRKPCSNLGNSECEIRCRDGYHQSGDAKRRCLPTGIWSGVELKCTLHTCPMLNPPVHGRIHCNQNAQNQSLNVPGGTRCEVTCDRGYVLRGSKFRNCHLRSGMWDGSDAACEGIMCKPLPRLANGHISPDICTGNNNVPYGTDCSIRCEAGFVLNGPRTRKCIGDRDIWSDRKNVSECVDKTAPTLVCPPDMFLDTLPGKNHALATWKKASASDNSGKTINVWTEGIVKLPWKAVIGVHTISYLAQDASANRANCSFKITVVDREPPTVQGCEDPPDYPSESSIGARNLIWDEPLFYDNSGYPVKTQQSRKPSEGIFALGTTRVLYSAKDKYDNIATCVLNITVKEACQFYPTPLNGNADCSDIGNEVSCIMKCSDGYGFATGPFGEHVDALKVTCDKSTQSWSHGHDADCSVTAGSGSLESGDTTGEPPAVPICGGDNPCP